MLLCRNPYIAPGGNAFGCGQCIPCRVNKRRMWTHRMMLETTQHPISSFWTLTYDDENLPWTWEDTQPLPTLEPKHLTSFLWSLRSDLDYHSEDIWRTLYEAATGRPRGSNQEISYKIRYFNVGEYGSTTERPHYHLALFNFPPCLRGLTQVNRSGNCCDICDRVRRIWGRGIVYSGQLQDASAAYIAGYCTKGITKKDDERLMGRCPEFARMSRKPGIGATFIPEVASALLTHNLEKTLPDVPTSLQTGCRVQPLGRYLTRELRKHIGRNPDAPQSTLDTHAEELQPLRVRAQEIAPKGLFKQIYRSLIVEANEGKSSRIEYRHKLYAKKECL